jgi:hypothetical protein
MDDEIALEAANSVRTALEAALENVSAQTVTIRRDEAILALGLISAMIEMINADIARRARPVV